MSNQKKFYINGAWVEPEVPNDLDVIDPSTEEVCATISIGGQADTDAAVAAAKAALPAWSATSPEERLGYLQKLLDAYTARAGEMATAISTEMGAPIKLASTAQVGAGMAHIANTMEALKNFTFEHPLDEENTNYGIVHEPIGVTALITP